MLLRQRPRKNVGRNAGIRNAIPAEALHGNFVSPSTHNHGVDRLPEVFHDYGDFFVPHQPIDSIIFTRNEVVETVRTAKRYFSHSICPSLLHSYALLKYPPESFST